MVSVQIPDRQRARSDTRAVETRGGEGAISLAEKHPESLQANLLSQEIGKFEPGVKQAGVVVESFRQGSSLWQQLKSRLGI